MTYQILFFLKNLPLPKILLIPTNSKIPNTPFPVTPGGGGGGKRRAAGGRQRSGEIIQKCPLSLADVAACGPPNCHVAADETN